MPIDGDDYTYERTATADAGRVTALSAIGDYVDQTVSALQDALDAAEASPTGLHGLAGRIAYVMAKAEELSSTIDVMQQNRRAVVGAAEPGA